MNLKKLFFVAMTVCTVLASCSEKDRNETVLKPISEHITGRWEITKMMTWTENAWSESQGNVIMNLFNDGTMYHIYEVPEKAFSPMTRDTVSVVMFVINEDTWTVDEDKNLLSFRNMLSGELFKLDAEGFEWGKPTSLTNGQQTMKYIAERKDSTEKCTIEKMLGKWNYVGSYEMSNGTWKESDGGEPEESTMEFKTDGTMKLYARMGEREATTEGKWGIAKETNELYINSPDFGWATNSKIEMEDDETMVMKYFFSTNWSTGEQKTGEFKDVYKLNK